MRLWLLLYLSIIPFTLSAREKKITLKADSETRRQILKAIEEQTGYSIAYPESGLNPDEKLHLGIRQAPLQQLLKKVLAGTGYTFRITGYHLLIIPEPDPLNLPSIQNIRGIVRHATTGEPIEMATVWLLNGPIPGTLTDSLGEFRLDNLPLGSYTLQFSHIGLSTEWIYDLELTEWCEEWCEVFLKDKSYFLKELVIEGERNREQSLNPMVQTGGRNIPLREANRYAGGLNDPARIAATFAGIAAIPGSNAVSVRGNAPQYNQWRLEGVELYNPSHFADIPFVGGGLYSGLNSQIIGHFDLLTGTFPAEYTNALGGIFDISLKQGNSEYYRHALQAGILGADFSSEGPIDREKGSSYLGNYRYFTTGLLGKLADNHSIHSHDMAVKIHLPTYRTGTFTLWGFGLFDQNKTDKPLKRPDEWKYPSDRDTYQVMLGQAAGGITHLWQQDSISWLKSTLAGGKVHNHPNVFRQPSIPAVNNRKIYDLKNQEIYLTLQSHFHKNYSRRHTNRSGIRATGTWYAVDFLRSPRPGLDYPAERIGRGKDITFQLSLYSQSLFRITDRLTAGVGMTGQFFSLIKKMTLEPRFSLDWRISNRQQLTWGYGIHSRREKMDYYYILKETENEKRQRQKIGFSYARHLSVSYGYTLTSGLQLKTDFYYQRLSGIPTEPGKSFSVINHESYFLDRPLENTGKGKNYGIDLTLQQHLVLGYYYMLSGSVFRSRYKGGDNIWRNSRYDKGFMVGAALGKEWNFGRQKQHRFGINLRASLQGGDRYSPIDRETTLLYHETRWDETHAYSLKHAPSFTGDIGFIYKLTEGRLTHQFSFQLIHMTTRQNGQHWDYNEKNGEIEKRRYNTILPDISYKLYF